MQGASLTVGAVDVRTICEGFAPLPLEGECPGQDVDWGAERRRYRWAFAGDGYWAWHVHAFLLRTPDAHVLVDTGVGTFGPWAPWGEDTGSQAWSAVDLTAVDHVVLTHLHADHAGGSVLADGTARFPNARYHVHPADWRHFEERSLSRPAGQGPYDARAAMAGLAAGGALSLEGEDHEVSAGVRVVHTPGHTPGHRSVLVEGSGAGVLLLTGDLLHLPIQIAHPRWPSSHDEDPARACVSRAAILGQAQEMSWRVAVSHFAHPFGGVGEGGWTSAT